MTTETIIALHIIGPDRFCTYCGRRLLHVNADGTFSLAGKAGVHLQADVYKRHPEAAEGLAVDARCCKRVCRLRRWWVERHD